MNVALEPPLPQSLEMRRTYAAPPERVFRAWTEAGALASWFCPSEDFTVTVHALEPEVGGLYRVEMRHRSGATHTATGTYHELVPGARLRFTWRWEESPAMTDTLVTIDLLARGAGTELVLTHEQFQNEGQRVEHGKGWTGCLDRLGQMLERS